MNGGNNNNKNNGSSNDKKLMNTVKKYVNKRYVINLNHAHKFQKVITPLRNMMHDQRSRVNKLNKK